VAELDAEHVEWNDIRRRERIAVGREPEAGGRIHEVPNQPG
jgi:hypothetical protein